MKRGSSASFWRHSPRGLHFAAQRCMALPPPAFSPDASFASLPFSSVCLGPGFHFFRCGVPRASQPCNTRQPSVPAAREDIPKINGNADQRPHQNSHPDAREPHPPGEQERRRNAAAQLRDDPHQKARLHISRAADEPDERADRGKQRVRPHRNAQKCCGLLNDRRVGIKTGGKLGKRTVRYPERFPFVQTSG